MQNDNRYATGYSSFSSNNSKNIIYSKYPYNQNGFDSYSSNHSLSPSSTSSSKIRTKEKRKYYDSNEDSDGGITKKQRVGLLNESLKQENIGEVDTIEDVFDTRLGCPEETGDETTIYNSIYNQQLPQQVKGSQRQYLIKWKNWSHVHATWESEESLKLRNQVVGLKKLEKFILVLREGERYKNNCNPDELERVLFAEEQHRESSYQKMQVDRIIHHQFDKAGSLEYFVKWKSLDYKFVTAESSESVVEPLFKAAIQDYKEKLASETIPNNMNEFLRRRPTFKPIQEDMVFGAGSTQLYLRDYQETGINWILKSWTKGRNIILADEMGLGKTIQTVCFISTLFKRYLIYGPYLVIVPLSTIDNWKKEFDLWAPELYTLVYSGEIASREIIRKYEWFVPNTKNFKFNVLLTTYEIVMNDKNLLSSIYWTFIGVDEAHRLKSSDSKLYKTIYPFKTNCRLLITGTPLQNNIKELWSLLHFIMPNIFDYFEKFENSFGTADNEKLCNDKLANLRDTIEPYILRREKKDVEKSLPAKSEQILRINMSHRQRELYRLVLAKNFESLLAETNKKTTFRNVIVELKKCCNHVELISDKLQSLVSLADREEYLIKSSGKMIVLDKLLTHLKTEGHRVLIFSQMVRMLDILDEYLRIKGWGFQRLDGSRSSIMRTEAIKSFNAPASTDFCFLLSTRAGGLGINLTTADTVIIFDSDWNPHADLQAMARAHRIGQTKQVSIYRFVIKSSVEEKIIERAKRKMVLDHLVIQRMEASGVDMKKTKSTLDIDDFEAILRFSAQEIFKECDDNDDTDFNLQTILKQAEIRDQEPSNATSAFLSSFKVISLDNDFHDTPAEIATEAEAKQWMNLIPKKYIDSVNKCHGNISSMIDMIPKKPESKTVTVDSKLNRLDIKRLVTTIQKFGCPQKRVDVIRSETELFKLDENQLCDCILEIIENCKKCVSSNENTTDNPTFEYLGFEINGKSVLGKIDSLSELHMVMNQYSDEERIHHEFLKETKPTSWKREWTREDDNHLLVGIYEHGMSNWREIKNDERLALKHKILRTDKTIMPQNKHLITRSHYLLDCLAKCKQPIKLKIKLGSNHNKSATNTKVAVPPNHLKVTNSVKSHVKSPVKAISEHSDSGDSDSSISEHSSTPFSDYSTDLNNFNDTEFTQCSGSLFNECKSFMKEYRKELSSLQKIITTEKNEDDFIYIDFYMLKIGDRIKSVISNMEKSNRSKYFKYLWHFVKIFCSNYSASNLFKMYEEAHSKKSY